MSKQFRVYKILVEAGIVRSKKDAVVIARAGRITVDGEVIESLHYQLNPWKRKLCVDGKEVQLSKDWKYFLFHKPAGLETTKENVLKVAGEKKIVAPEVLNSLYPVGRLDKDSSGLLIVTNEGKLGNRVLNPKFALKKVYHVVTSKRVAEEELQKLRKGVVIELEENGVVTKYRTLPAMVHECGKYMEVAITEGKKRQVRRMFAAIGHDVISLCRVSIGKLDLGNIPPGEFKEVPREEVYEKLFGVQA